MNWKRFSIVALLYSLLTVCFTYPLIQNFASGFLGIANDDSAQYIWNFYTFWNNVQQGQNLFYSNEIFYPYGSSLVYHTYTPSISIWGVFFNDVLSINLNIFFHFLCSALGGFYFAKLFLKNNFSAFFVGLIFAFSPYKLLNLPLHYNLILTANIPWFCYFYVQSIRVNPSLYFIQIISVKHFSIAFILLLSSVFCDYHVFFFMMYFAIFYILIHLYFLSDFLCKHWWKILPISLVAFHLFIDYLLHHGFKHGEGFYWSSDFLNLYIPHQYSLLYNKIFPKLSQYNYFRKNADIHAQIFIGYAFSAITIVASMLYIFKKNYRNKNTTIFLILSVIFIMISIPRGHFAGIKTLNFPFGILHFLPILEKLRVSARFMSMVYLFLPIFTFSVLESYFKKRYTVYAISFCAILFTAIEYKTFNFPVFSKKDIPNSIYTLKQEPKSALLCLPTGLKDGSKEIGDFETNQLFYQTIHQKPIIGGYISRIDSNLIKKHHSDKIISEVFALSQNPNKYPEMLYPKDIQLFFDIYKVKYFLVKNEIFTPSIHSFLQRILKDKKIRKTIKDEHFTIICLE